MKSSSRDEDRGSPSPYNPEETGRSSLSPAKKVAGGLPSVAAAVKHALDEMGAVRSIKTLSKVNQTDGFDCPGCAWPDPDDRRAMVEFCENGAKAVAEEATRKRIDAEFFEHWSIAELSRKSDYWLGKQGRLTSPMWRRPESDHYEPIAWQDAFGLIARELNQLQNPDEAVFYTSGRTSNEAAFLYQLFVRLFGTNNLPDCSNMCHESSGVALKEVIGVGKGTVTLEDFDHADAIFVIGQNPGTNHPRMLSTLQKAARRGCRIVSINPLPEAGTSRFIHPQEITTWAGSGTQLAHLFLPVKINGDVALLKGIVKEIFEADALQPENGIDRDFIANYTTGFDEFSRDISQASWEVIVRESGVDRDLIKMAAGIILKSRAIIWCWAMGLTQHKNAVANIQEIVNLILLGGHLGRSGAGVCPVRGHSNVQGDRTMGIWERPSDTFLDNLATTFHFEPPRRPGHNTISAIKAMLEGEASFFLAMGGNFLSATPDTELTARALRQCRLTTHISTKLNRAHLITGHQALILPCLGRTEIDLQKSGEQFVSVENSMGIVHTSRGNLKPASAQLLSEPAIVSGLAKAVFKGQTDKMQCVDWDYVVADYDRIRELISRTIPGFEDYNNRVRRRGGFYLPNPVRDHRKFETETGKAVFTVHAIPETKIAPDQFTMMTIRSHDQYNTTIYGLHDRYRGVTAGRRVVFMNDRDMSDAGLKAKDLVDVTSHFNGTKRIARKFRVIPYPIPRRCVASYFPEANVLVPLDSIADKSHTPTSKSIIVTITKHPGE